VVQDVPRRQRVGIGLYDLNGDGRLQRRRLMHAELDAERTVVPGLTSADAVMLNDQDLSYTRTGFDARSARVLTAAACQVGDPLSEAVCWNGFWLLVTSGELPAAQFADMACRRLQAGGLPEAGVETLLSRAVEAADAWAPPRQRAGLREQIADATRPAAGDARKLALGFAASAQADDQLAALDAWLAGKDLPGGLAIDAELRARILFTLAARGLARGEDIDALPRLDPGTGEVNRATCLAMLPDLAAKEAAWAVPLSSGEPARIALACAAGIWVPGQEELMATTRLGPVSRFRSGHRTGQLRAGPGRRSPGRHRRGHPPAGNSPSTGSEPVPDWLASTVPTAPASSDPTPLTSGPSRTAARQAMTTVTVLRTVTATAHPEAASAGTPTVISSPGT
jgi:aminopeptidase N